MQIDKEMIVNMLRQRGDQQQAQQAESELPQQVDPGQHGDLLSRFGIDPQELIQKFMGGGGGGEGGGGIGGMLGDVAGGFGK